MRWKRPEVRRGCAGPSAAVGTLHSVPDLATAAIAAGAALLSSGLTGVLALRIAGVERDDRSKAELAAAMAAYGYAVDRLGLEIGQLPPTPSRAGRATAAVVGRLPTLDWSLGQLSRHTLGRPGMRALDAYTAAMNRLMLIAPKPVLTAVERVNGLLAMFENRSPNWSTEWQEARNDFAIAARDALTASS